jgi:CRP-like cAMP-binding protein
LPKYTAREQASDKVGQREKAQSSDAITRRVLINTTPQIESRARIHTLEGAMLRKVPLLPLVSSSNQPLPMTSQQTTLRLSVAELEAVFSRRGWLSEHPSSFRTRLLDLAIPTVVSPGLAVFREGEESDGLFGVVSGAVGVEGGHRRQSPLLGHIMRSGEWFGIKAVLLGGARGLTYRAIEPTALVVVSNARLLPLMRKDPDLALRVGQLAEIGNRLGAWAVRDLLTPNASRRLAAVLYRALGMGEVAPDDPRGFWLTHQQLGEMANLSRHHVGRKLAMFESAGWIAGGYNRIRMLDPGGLADFAFGDEDS